MKRIDFSVQKIDWRVVAVVAFNDDIDDLRIAKDKDLWQQEIFHSNMAP